MSVQISMHYQEQKKSLELSQKTEQKSFQYVLDRCIVEDVDTNVDGSTRTLYVWKMLRDWALREDFERERTQLVDQIDQKDKQIADMIETSNSQLQLIGTLTMKNEKHYC